MRRAHAGVTTVEFAIIGSLLMIVVFGIIEMGRALYVVNVLTEAARRGARMAAVCPVGDPKPAQVAVFDTGGGTSSVVSGLTETNVQVDYLDGSNNVLPNPASNFGSIRYVRVSIKPFTMPLFIPVIAPTLNLSGFAATLPRESLGVPRTGTIQPC
jgi:Flp pilus assembly protein TadG